MSYPLPNMPASAPHMCFRKDDILVPSALISFSLHFFSSKVSPNHTKAGFNYLPLCEAFCEALEFMRPLNTFYFFYAASRLSLSSLPTNYALAVVLIVSTINI